MSRLVAMAADCKSALFGVRWFESNLIHHNSIMNAVLLIATNSKSSMRCETRQTMTHHNIRETKSCTWASEIH